jgi:GTP 3',8-cyclase
VSLSDGFGRVIRKLRVSVTDRCDLRCTYCMPAAGLNWLPRSAVLSYEEITRVARIAVGLGVVKLRLTGGEPLVRADLPTLVAMLSKLPGAPALALTTNGIRLAAMAEELSAAGLQSVNVSLDALDPVRFHELTRRDAVDRVLAGLRVAARVFPGRVKVNAVAMPGVTEAELPAFLELAHEHDLMVRFIEFMPLDADASWDRDTLLSGAQLLERVRALTELEPQPCSGPSSPAVEYRLRGGRGGVGFINSVSQPFCESCDRIRLTADGRLRSCLFSLRETNLMPFVRGGSDAEIQAALEHGVRFKEAGHKINDPDFVRGQRSMSQIGG